MIKPIRNYRAGSGYFKALIKASITPFQQRGRAARLLGLSGGAVLAPSVYANLPFVFHYLRGSLAGHVPNLLVGSDDAYAIPPTRETSAPAAPAPAGKTPAGQLQPSRESVQQRNISERSMSLPGSDPAHSHAVMDSPSDAILHKLNGMDVRQMILNYQRRYRHTTAQDKNFIVELSRLLEQTNFPVQKPLSATGPVTSAAVTVTNPAAKSGEREIPGRQLPPVKHAAALWTQYVVPGQRAKPFVAIPARGAQAEDNSQETESFATTPASMSGAQLHAPQAETPQAQRLAKSTSIATVAVKRASTAPDLPYVRTQTGNTTRDSSATDNSQHAAQQGRQVGKDVQSTSPVVRLLQGGSMRTQDFADGSDFFTRNYIGHPNLIVYK